MKKILIMFVLMVLMLYAGCREDKSDEITNNDSSQVNVEQMDGSIILHDFKKAYYRNGSTDMWKDFSYIDASYIYRIDGFDDEYIERHTRYYTEEKGYYFKYEYDEYGRLNKIFLDEKLFKTFFFSSEGMICNIYDEEENPVESQRYTYHLNSLGQIECVEVCDNSNQELLFTIYYQYDNDGHIVSRKDISSNEQVLKRVNNLYQDDVFLGSRIVDIDIVNNNVMECVYLINERPNPPAMLGRIE